MNLKQNLRKGLMSRVQRKSDAYYTKNILSSDKDNKKLLPLEKGKSLGFIGKTLKEPLKAPIRKETKFLLGKRKPKW